MNSSFCSDVRRTSFDGNGYRKVLKRLDNKLIETLGR